MENYSAHSRKKEKKKKNEEEGGGGLEKFKDNWNVRTKAPTSIKLQWIIQYDVRQSVCVSVCVHNFRICIYSNLCREVCASGCGVGEGVGCSQLKYV